MNRKLVLGNIITMDESNPTAEAVVIQDGCFVYVGTRKEAGKLCDEKTEVLDYGKNSIYPGFLESHAHGLFAGYRAIGQADLSMVFPTDYEAYRRIIREFIAAHPEKQIYIAAGWTENEEKVTKKYLDDICSDQPLIMNTGSGHSCLLNTKALEWAHIDAKFAAETGYDMVHVDENGEPDGYLCENPAIAIINSIPITETDAESYVLFWQDLMLKKGYTAAGEAGAELMYKGTPEVYHKLDQEGKLKLRTFAYHMVPDNAADPEGEAERIAQEREKYSGKYYQVIGVKAFLDGVTEAHTAWLLEDYCDQPGYSGVRRFSDSGKMIRLITAADRKKLSVHVHAEGDGAAKFILDCIRESQKLTGDKDQRNVIAHLHFVKPEEIKAMAETGSIPAVAPLWTAKFFGGEYENELAFVGEERSDESYPIRSFFEAGARPVFHSDYPISPVLDISRSIYMAEFRAIPEEEFGGIKSQRNAAEAIGRKQSLEAMTLNPAYAWKQEDRLGSIEKGKIANLSVFDCDFLKDDVDKVVKASVVATVIDGEEVYRR